MPNRFFGPSFDSETPSRLYALSIGFSPDTRELFDAVDADALDGAQTAAGHRQPLDGQKRHSGSNAQATRRPSDRVTL